jgi:hypothetical protein
MPRARRITGTPETARPRWKGWPVPTTGEVGRPSRAAGLLDRLDLYRLSRPLSRACLAFTRGEERRHSANGGYRRFRLYSRKSCRMSKAWPPLPGRWRSSVTTLPAWRRKRSSSARSSSRRLALPSVTITSANCRRSAFTCSSRLQWAVPLLIGCRPWRQAGSPDRHWSWHSWADLSIDLCVLPAAASRPSRRVSRLRLCASASTSAKPVPSPEARGQCNQVMIPVGETIVAAILRHSASRSCRLRGHQLVSAGVAARSLTARATRTSRSTQQ